MNILCLFQIFMYGYVTCDIKSLKIILSKRLVSILNTKTTLSAGVVKYADCISAEG